MSVLDDTFKFFAKGLPVDHEWYMDAILTGTKLSSLSAFVATTAGAGTVAYDPGATPGLPATIKFDATLQFQLEASKQKGITVTLSADPAVSGGGYSMKIVFPWTTVDCVPNVDDAASGVVYGSQGNQFVTLVLKASKKSVPK